jgi:uncharacterized membrane protein YwaF
VIHLLSSFWLHPSNPSFDALSAGGIFSFPHFVLTFTFLTLGYFGLFFIKRMGTKSQTKTLRALSILLVIMEISRMLWNFFAADGWYAKDVWPLYTCGIFVFLFPLYAFDTKGKIFAEGFIKLGALPSGVLFMLFPSTGIGMFPLWHYNTIQSALMHTVMAMIGALLFFDQSLKFQKRDITNAFIVITVFAGISWIYNSFDPNINFFFIASPLEGTPLTILDDIFGQPGYGISIYLIHLLVGFLMYIYHQKKVLVRGPLPESKLA